MSRTPMLLLLLCFHLTLGQEVYKSSYEEYNIEEGDELNDSTITQLKGPIGSDPSNRLGLASPASGKSSVWASVMNLLQNISQEFKHSTNGRMLENIGHNILVQAYARALKALSPDDPSINEIDSEDYFPSIVDISTTTEKDNSSSNNVTISTTTDAKDNFSQNDDNITTTDKPDIMWGMFINSSSSNNETVSSTTDAKDDFPSNYVNITITDMSDLFWGMFINNSGIYPHPDNHTIFEWKWGTSANATEKVDTGLTVSEHPTSFTEFINAQLSLLAPMWTNLTKMTDHFSREVIDTLGDTIDTLGDTVFAVMDFIFNVIDSFFSCFLDKIFDYDYVQDVLDYAYDY